MNAHEFALLFAVAVPVLSLVGLNAFLAAAGERGTLLLPGVASFPSEGPMVDEPTLIAGVRVPVEAANDADEKLAA